MDHHAYWTTYLAKAKNGNDRPIHGSTTKRVLWGPGDSIRLRLHNTDVITHHPDGTETIRTDGWNTVTTRKFLRDHSRARVWSEKGQWTVAVRDPEITPAKIQKCRTCHGAGRTPRTCSVRACHPEWHRDRVCQHGRVRQHRQACRHGVLSPRRGWWAEHPDGTDECYDCHGEGRRDYGSKAVHYAWSGHPLTIDADGYAVVPGTVPDAPAPQTWTVPGTGVQVAPSKTYGDSGRLLASALPGLSASVDCPHCEQVDTLDLIIIHLNDAAWWTREQVADWLDTLDVDLTFPTPDTIPAHIH